MFCFQAEGGIRYRTVTGVQTCALPISRAPAAWHLAMWSPELNAKLLELAQTKVAMYDAYISEMEQMPTDETYLQQLRYSLGSRPILVLSTGNHGVHRLDPARPKSMEQQKYQEQVAR